MKDNITQSQLLESMGIQQWELLHPSRLSGVKQTAIDLPESCRLLLVSPVKPEGEIVLMFEKVLKSLKLDLQQSMHLFPEQLSQLENHQLSWVWFSGSDKLDIENTKTLESPLLSEIEGNTQERRNLWQQICSYEK